MSKLEEVQQQTVQMERCKALEFLEKVGVKDGEALASEDPLAFLDALLPAFMANVPFQSVSMVALEEEERRVPTLEEVVEAGLSLEGGVCFTVNTFMCILLRSLGLDAHVLDGTYTSSHSPHNHVVVLVKNLRFEGDDHFVDVGGGQPFLKAVSVASLPATFFQAGLEYRYCRRGDRVLRLNRTGDNKPEDEKAVMVGEWRQVFDFSLNTVDYDYFRPYMESLYTSEESPFFKFMRAVRFPPADPLLGDPTAHKGDSNPSAEISSMKKDGCIQEIDTETKASDSSLQTKNFRDRKIFPAFSEDVVTTVDEITSSECDTKSKVQYDNRIMVAIRNQSLLLGPMSAAVKTKVSAEDWANEIKHFFPNIPPAKVDLAVQRKLAMSTQH